MVHQKKKKKKNCDNYIFTAYMVVTNDIHYFTTKSLANKSQIHRTIKGKLFPRNKKMKWLSSLKIKVTSKYM